jgi:hypothetical protein
MSDETILSVERQFDFQFHRFTLLNEKASFVLAFGSLIVAILFGVLDVSGGALKSSSIGLVALGIGAFFLADVLSIFIILPRSIGEDVATKQDLKNSIERLKDQNDLFGVLLSAALLFLLFAITAISFSLLSLLFSNESLTMFGWVLSFAIPIAVIFILHYQSKQSTQ